MATKISSDTGSETFPQYQYQYLGKLIATMVVVFVIFIVIVLFFVIVIVQVPAQGLGLSHLRRGQW